MSIEIILGGIGTALGIANFFYWAWWAKRDKVAVAIHESWANFVPKGDEEIGPGGKLIILNNHFLHIYVSCTLVLTSGEKEIEVRGVEIKLDKVTCEKLKRYFRLPNGNGFPLHKYAPDPRNGELEAVLQPKKSVDFTEDRLFECTDKFKEEYEKLGSGSSPQFIEPLLEQLGHKYQICWTRYDGKVLCWKFPQTWWRNLGKRL